MIGKFLDILKPAFLVGVVFLLLQATGLTSGLSFVTQSAAIQSGLLDARANEATANPPEFDYNFMIKDMDGNKLSFEQFRGKVIFLNLWATWCGPCRAEMPTIQKLYSGKESENVQFVMLSLDKDQDKPKIIKYIQSKSFTFPVYQPSGSLSEQLRVPSIPTTFIISKEGKIVATEVGTTNFNTPKFKAFIHDLAAN